jgi:hypothetical protein
MSTEDINEENFRARCAVACARHPDLPHLKSIAAVGAYDAEIGGDGKDSIRLTNALDYALRSGFLIDPDFEIDIINFRDGRDFLFEDKPADLVFVAYILSGSYPFLPKFWKGEPRVTDKVSLSDMISRRNDHVEWAHHIDEIGAKLIVTYGGNIEVNAQTFRRQYGLDYDVLIPSPDEECMDRYVARKDMQPFYPTLPKIDIPQCWLGFSARHDFLQATQPSLHKGTTLGAQALKQLSAPALSPAAAISRSIMKNVIR